MAKVDLSAEPAFAGQAPGTRRAGWLEFGASWNGPYRLPLVVIKGAKPGPRLVAVGAQHADEVYGVLALLKAAERVDPAKVTGDLLMVPCLNTFGYLNGKHDNPMDQQDMNMVHPGNSSGRLTHQSSAVLYQRILPGADFLIDFHGGSVELGNIPFVRWTQGGPKAREIAEQLGIDHIEDPIDPNATFPGMMSKAALDIGVPSISIETGSCLRYPREVADEMVTYLERALRALAMLPGPANPKGTPRYARMVGTRSTMSGAFETFVSFGQEVKKGEVLGLVRDFTGQATQQAIAPADGVVGVMRTGVRVHPGESLVWLLVPTATPPTS